MDINHSLTADVRTLSGAHELSVTGLSTDILRESVRVSGGKGNATILEVKWMFYKEEGIDQLLLLLLVVDCFLQQVSVETDHGKKNEKETNSRIEKLLE